jgi:hypothetical protein
MVQTFFIFLDLACRASHADLLRGSALSPCGGLKVFNPRAVQMSTEIEKYDPIFNISEADKAVAKYLTPWTPSGLFCFIYL